MSDKPSFSAIYAFGDSLSDAGNAYSATTALGTPEPVSPPYFQETYQFGTVETSADVFSNGPNWVQDLSLSLGLGTLAPTLLGATGTDYAFGGAVTGAAPENPSGVETALTSLQAQVGSFEAAPGTAPPDALYTIWIGANDIFNILGDTGLSAAQQTIDITDSVDNEIAAVKQLASGGAKNLLVLDVPDLGKTPEVTSGQANGSGTPSSTLDTLASDLSAEYNAALTPALVSVAQADSLDLHILDTYSIIDDAVADPSAFGLTNVTGPVWSGNFTSASSGTLAATGTAAQDHYLFFDDFHPTETGHALIAADALAALEGPPACFAAGTRICTAAGEIPIEQLRVGDRVWTCCRERLAPVAWFGYHHIDCHRHPRPHEAWPVRIAAHAFGEGMPHRDLLLSPDHKVSVDGVLVPVRMLTNGATITQRAVSAVTYWHLETARHDTVLAEGLAAESYLDTGNRAAFAHAREGGHPTAPAPIIASPATNAAVMRFANGGA